MFPPVAVWIVLAVVVIINLVFKTIDRICAALKQTKLEATLDKHTEQPWICNEGIAWKHFLTGSVNLQEAG